MGCNTSKGCLINGDDNESHYTYTYHKPNPPIHRIDSDNNLGPIITTPICSSPIRSSSLVLHGHDMEIQGKRRNDNRNHAASRRAFGSVQIMQQEEIMFPNFVEAPSFKDYLISSPDNDDDHIKKIINTDGSSDDDDVENEEEKKRIETADNYSSVYASAREAPSPIPIREESANKNDAIVGELPPRDSIIEKKSKVKRRRRWVMAREKLKNMVHTSSWIPHYNHNKSIRRVLSTQSHHKH